MRFKVVLNKRSTPLNLIGFGLNRLKPDQRFGQFQDLFHTICPLGFYDPANRWEMVNTGKKRITAHLKRWGKNASPRI